MSATEATTPAIEQFAIEEVQVVEAVAEQQLAEIPEATPVPEVEPTIEESTAEESEATVPEVESIESATSEVTVVPETTVEEVEMIDAAPEPISSSTTEPTDSEKAFDDTASEATTNDSSPSHRVIWPLFKDIDYADPNMPLSPKASTRLRQMLARPGIVVAPGVCDGISARCTLQAGFQCLYQSGAATTASRLGQPDLAIATLNDFVENAAMISGLSPSTPLIADADTGFGGPAMVGRTLKKYDRVGVAALHIEDQVQTKRCGHLLGKQVVSTEEFLARIRAAVIARSQIPGGSDIVIIGRTDSAQVLGMEEALRRLKAAADVGADVCFIEGVRTKEDLKKTVDYLAPTPVLCNIIAGGLTPPFTYSEAEQLGAKIIIYSLVTAVAAVHGIRAALESLKKTGTDFESAKGMGPKSFFEIVGLKEVIDLDAQAGGTAFSQV